MARRARIQYPGTVYHIMLLGNGSRDIFFDEADRIRFYNLLKEGVIRSNRLRNRVETNPRLTVELERIRDDLVTMQTYQA